jgi:hypothetical protein
MYTYICIYIYMNTYIIYVYIFIYIYLHTSIRNQVDLFLVLPFVVTMSQTAAAKGTQLPCFTGTKVQILTPL